MLSSRLTNHAPKYHDLRDLVLLLLGTKRPFGVEHLKAATGFTDMEIAEVVRWWEGENSTSTEHLDTYFSIIYGAYYLIVSFPFYGSTTVCRLWKEWYSISSFAECLLELALFTLVIFYVLVTATSNRG